MRRKTSLYHAIAPFLEKGLHGATVIRGTNITMALILDLVHQGFDRSVLADQFPELPEDVLAALYHTEYAE